MQKFVEIPRNEGGYDKENLWFEKCQREAIPFITIKTRTKLANVHWDYITYPTELDIHLRNNRDEIIEKAKSIFMVNANPKSSYRTSEFLIYFDNLEIESARVAAEALFELISEIISKYESAQA